MRMDDIIRIQQTRPNAVIQPYKKYKNFKPDILDSDGLSLEVLLVDLEEWEHEFAEAIGIPRANE